MFYEKHSGLLESACLCVCFQSQFLLSLQAISIMVHFYMGTKGPDNVSALTHASSFRSFLMLYHANGHVYHMTRAAPTSSL